MIEVEVTQEVLDYIDSCSGEAETREECAGRLLDIMVGMVKEGERLG